MWFLPKINKPRKLRGLLKNHQKLTKTNFVKYTYNSTLICSSINFTFTFFKGELNNVELL
jgi:hypothetical protein